MKRRIIIPAIVGIAVISVPAAASAAMAYVNVPKHGSLKTYAMLANDNGSNPVRVAAAISASISPDGARLAYQNYAGPKANAPTTTVRDIASGLSASVGTSCLGGIRWSPDSKWIACNTQTLRPKGGVTGNGLGLIAVPATLTGGQALSVANYIAPVGNEVDYGVAFSPDSSQIAFSLRRFNSKAPAGTLYVAPITDAASRVAVLQRASGPVWGPSGIAASQSTMVMVTMGGSRERMLHTQVWTVNPDGSSARRITNYKAKGFMVGPSAMLWVPGGARIIGNIVGDDALNLAAFAVPGGATTRLVNTSSPVPAAVTPDGQRVLYVTLMGESGTSIRMIGMNGKGKRVLVRQAASPSVTADWNA